MTATILNIRDYVSKTKREPVAGSGEVHWLDTEKFAQRFFADTAPSDWPFVDCPYTAPGDDCA